MSEKKGQTKVRVFSDWCKGCGICVEFCPGNVFEIGKDGKSQVVHEEECLNCGFCEMHCPDFAVSVRPKNGNGIKTMNGRPNGHMTPAIRTQTVTANTPEVTGEPDVPDHKGSTES